MGWKIFYDAILDRELERLEGISSRMGSEKVYMQAGRSQARQFLIDISNTFDFWVEDLIENEGITRLENVLNMMETVERNKGTGILKEYLPRSWLDEINSKISEVYSSLISFYKYSVEFSRYLIGWSNIKLEQPIQIEVRTFEPECYSLLFGFHGSVQDITNEEFEEYLERVRNGKYMLIGMIDSYNQVTPLNILNFLDPFSLETFLKNYASRDEFNWRYEVYPRIKDGLASLSLFLQKKGIKLEEPRLLAREVYQNLLDRWKQDLIRFDREALERYGRDKEKREKLAKKYEVGIGEEVEV